AIGFGRGHRAARSLLEHEREAPAPARRRPELAADAIAAARELEGETPCPGRRRRRGRLTRPDSEGQQIRQLIDSARLRLAARGLADPFTPLACGSLRARFARLRRAHKA